MFKALNNINPGVKLIIKLIVIYLIWTIIRESFEKISFLNPIWNSLNDLVAKTWINWSAPFVKLFYKELIYNGRNLFFNGNDVIYVGNHCLGIAPMFIYTAIIWLNGMKTRRKIVFSSSGLFGIVVLNIFRIVGLAWLLNNTSEWFFHFNHTYTYLAMMYGFIFLMIIWFFKDFKDYIESPEN